MGFMIYFSMLLGLPLLAIGFSVWAYCKLTGKDCPIEW